MEMNSTATLTTPVSGYIETTDLSTNVPLVVNNRTIISTLYNGIHNRNMSEQFTSILNAIHKDKLDTTTTRKRKNKHNRNPYSWNNVNVKTMVASQEHKLDADVHVHPLELHQDMSTVTYVTLVCVFYGAALFALFISLCCRRRMNSVESVTDNQDYYENYMKTKERVRRISLMQRLRRIRRLWNAAEMYKMPVNVI